MTPGLVQRDFLYSFLGNGIRGCRGIGDAWDGVKGFLSILCNGISGYRGINDAWDGAKGFHVSFGIYVLRCFGGL